MIATEQMSEIQILVLTGIMTGLSWGSGREADTIDKILEGHPLVTPDREAVNEIAVNFKRLVEDIVK